MSTPVSAQEIARRSYEQRHLIEDMVISNLVETMNQGIKDQVLHGMLTYEFYVPCFILGFPKFDVDYVASTLKKMYHEKGFGVRGEGATIVLEWATHPSKHAAGKKQAPSGSGRSNSSSNSKKVLLLPG